MEMNQRGVWFPCSRDEKENCWSNTYPNTPSHGQASKRAEGPLPHHSEHWWPSYEVRHSSIYQLWASREHFPRRMSLMRETIWENFSCKKELALQRARDRSILHRLWRWVARHDYTFWRGKSNSPLRALTRLKFKWLCTSQVWVTCS